MAEGTALSGQYLGMHLSISDIDVENRDFFRYCGEHNLHLQECTACGLVRYPPTTACPWCTEPESRWVPVEGKGTVHSYGEVHHPLQAAFRDHVPYQVLLVELDHQRAKPSEHEALRFMGNLVTGSGELAPPDLVARVGIGSRVRVVYCDVGEGFAIPQWAIDGDGGPPPWRYAQE